MAFFKIASQLNNLRQLAPREKSCNGMLDSRVLTQAVETRCDLTEFSFPINEHSEKYDILRKGNIITLTLEKEIYLLIN